MQIRNTSSTNLVRLRRELQEFLLDERISLEAELVNKFIYQMAEVTLVKEANRYRYTDPGLKLFHHDENEIQFEVPTLTDDELTKLCTFFKIDRKKYITNTPLTLDPTFVFNEFIPQFKAYFQSVKKTNPDEINKYRIESKKTLEAQAVTTLKVRTTEIMDIITPKESTEASLCIWALRGVLDDLQNKVSCLGQSPTLYQKIIDHAATVHNYLQFPEVNANADLVKKIKVLVEGIDLFKRYHRNESVLANRAFVEKMRKFLEDDYKIATSQCHVIEETLLRLAQAQLGKHPDCGVDIGYDAARLVFSFTDMDKQNMDKVIQFLRDAGDETALEGYGHRTYGHSLTETAELCSAKSLRVQDLPPREVYECHSIETDGKFFYEKIFPLLKNEIAAMKLTDPATLQKYRDDSSKYFELQAAEKAEKTPKPDMNRLFTPEVIRSNTVNDEPEVQDNSMKLG